MKHKVLTSSFKGIKKPTSKNYIFLAVLLVIFISLKSNAQSYTWSGYTLSPPCDQLQSNHGTMAIMQGSGSGAGSALTALGINQTDPQHMLDVYNGDINISPITGFGPAFNSYLMAGNSVLTNAGDPTSIFVGEQGPLTYSQLGTNSPCVRDRA